MSSNSLTYTASDAYHGKSAWNIYKRCIKLIFEHKRFTIQLIVFGLLASGSRAAIMFLLNGVTSYIGGTFSLLLLGGYMTLLLGACISSYGFTYLAHLKTQDVLREMQTSLIYKASSVLCASNYSPSGSDERLDLLLLLRQDVRSVRNISLSLMNMALMGANIAAVFFSLFSISWQVAVIIPLILLPVIWHIAMTNRKIITESLNIREHIMQNAGTTGKFLKALPILKLFDSGEIGPSIISRMIRERLLMRLNLAKLKYFTVFLSGVAGSIGIIGIVGLAVTGVGGLNVEGIVPALVGFFMVQQSIGNFIQLTTRLHEFIPIARHYFNKSDHWQESISSENNKTVLDSIRSIEFSDTRFFDESKQTTGWNFKIETGCIYGMIARKAPVFDLLIEVLTIAHLPIEGRIMINGKDYGKYASRSLFGNIIYLSSNIPILPLTVRENIKLANNNISEDELGRIIEKLNLNEMFLDLKQGFDTDLRQRDTKLSPVQEAAIGVARLIASSASLYVVDMHALGRLSAEHVDIVMEHLVSRKDEAVILIKPSGVDDLEYCDRVLLFKRYDLLMDASRRDLEENIQRNYFYINPHPKVCIAPMFSSDPEKYVTFERAVYSYKILIQGLDEISDNATADGYKNEVSEDLKIEQIDQELEDEMELG